MTGGGQGLGKVFSLAFAKAGADVVVAELNPETGPETTKEIEAMGRRALFVETDVRSRLSIETMVEKTVERFGRLDFIMNNAGIVKWCPAESVTEKDWREVIDVNLTASSTAARPQPGR